VSLLYTILVTLELLAAVTAIIIGIDMFRQRRRDMIVIHYVERRRNGASSSSTSP
jgi:hypothetical protein